MLAFLFASVLTETLFYGVYSDAGNVWTYRGSLGPQHWHIDYPHCGGVKQSPINIDTNDVIVDTSHLQPFQFTGYDSVQNVNMSMINNGHTVQVDLSGMGSQISGGGLPGDIYVAQQFHFHWGAIDARGSEHSLNDEHFPMEMHIVHYNKKYNNLDDALDEEDGLAVLAFFFMVGKFNDHFEEIINHFGQIKHASDRASIHAIPLKELIPAKLQTYYRYEGSLTTPPCYETVSWTIFHERIEIAEEQLQDFRTKIFENRADEGIDVDISDDFRPIQCMNSRRVYASHESLKFSVKEMDGTSSAITVKMSAFVAVILCLLSGVFICDTC